MAIRFRLQNLVIGLVPLAPPISVAKRVQLDTEIYGTSKLSAPPSPCGSRRFDHRKFCENIYGMRFMVEACHSRFILVLFEVLLFKLKSFNNTPTSKSFCTRKSFPKRCLTSMSNGHCPSIINVQQWPILLSLFEAPDQ